jgi:hypothetical protein
MFISKMSPKQGPPLGGAKSRCDLQDPGHRGVLREDIDGEREELQKELDLVRKHSSIWIPEELQGNRKYVQERGFRAGRREWRAGKIEARCKHKLALDLHTKGASNN